MVYGLFSGKTATTGVDDQGLLDTCQVIKIIKLIAVKLNCVITLRPKCIPTVLMFCQWPQLITTATEDGQQRNDGSRMKHRRSMKETCGIPLVKRDIKVDGAFPG